jgi:hypothetical protein
MNPDSDCLMCEGTNPVNWLLTRLNPGATIRVCAHDIRTALATLLATEMGVDADWLIDVINEKLEEMSSLEVVADTPRVTEAEAEALAEQYADHDEPAAVDE